MIDHSGELFRTNGPFLRRIMAGACAVGLLGAAGCTTASEDGNNSAQSSSSVTNGGATEGNGEESGQGSASSTGRSTEAQTESVFNVNEGDCLKIEDSLTGVVEDLEKIDCERPHNAEIFAQKEMADGNFPGDEAIAEQAKNYCVEEFSHFVGIPGSESELKVNFLHPSETSWDEEQDRRIQCVVIDSASEVTGTFKDARR